jgi:hypothetical protein
MKDMDVKGGLKLSNTVDFDDWEFGMRVEFWKKAVLALVLGSETQLLSSDNLKAAKGWIAKCDVATATIIGRLDPSQFAHVREFEEDPVRMWERLRETHLCSGLGGAVVLWCKFHTLCKPGDPSSMGAHVATIRGLAEKLGCLHQDKPSDVQIIVTLLVSLPLAYDTLIISLNVHPQKEDLNFIIGCLLNKETHQKAVLSMNNTADIPTTVLVSRTNQDMSHITYMLQVPGAQPLPVQLP